MIRIGLQFDFKLQAIDYEYENKHTLYHEYEYLL